jgi:hypothetical protein
MKIRYRKKRDGSASITFKADSDEDGVNLKNAVLAGAKTGGFGVDGLVAIIEELERAGYGVDDKTSSSTATKGRNGTKRST